MATRYRNQTSVASQIRQRVSAAPDGHFFHVADFPGSSRAVESAISRMHLAGQLIRVHKGVYWKPVEDPFAPAPAPDPVAVALQVARDRGVGPAGRSAAAHLGLVEERPDPWELAVVGEPPTSVEGVVFYSRANAQRVVCSYDEIAILELLRDWPAHVDAPDFDRLVGAAARRMESGGEVHPDRLRAAARGEQAAARRLAGQLTRQLGHVGV